MKYHVAVFSNLSLSTDRKKMSVVGNAIYPHPRSTSKLSTRIDADGKEVEVIWE